MRPTACVAAWEIVWAAVRIDGGLGIINGHGTEERWTMTERRSYANIFGVGILARIRSSSSTVTRSTPFLRQDSSTARTTIPRTNAGILFIRSVAASSQEIVF